MRCACGAISASTRLRSASLSGSWLMVSTKPASTVNGVRISCDTLATKLRRISSVRSRSVMSCGEQQLQAFAIGLHQHRQAVAIARPGEAHRLSQLAGAARCSTKAGARTRLVIGWARSRFGSSPR